MRNDFFDAGGRAAAERARGRRFSGSGGESPGGDLGDARQRVRGPHGQRLADPPLHRPRGALPVRRRRR